MPLLLIVLIIAAALLIAVLIASLWIVKQALYPRKFSYEKSYLIELENGRFNEERVEQLGQARGYPPLPLRLRPFRHLAAADRQPKRPSSCCTAFPTPASA